MAGTAFAADYFVSPTGKDSNPGTQAQPFGSPEQAFMSLKAGEDNTITFFENGTYKVGTIRIEDNIKVKVFGNGSTFKAADKPGKEGGEGNRIFRIGTGTDVEFNGLTMMNGRQVAYFGGGAIFFMGTRLLVENCAFIDNEAGSAGGAINSRGNDVIIRDSYFQGNYTIAGGATGAAICQVGNKNTPDNPGTLTVENCAFVENELRENGGGHAVVISQYDPCLDVCMALATKFTITNCTFFNNKTIQGYMADIDVTDNGECELVLVNNTFYGSEVALRYFFQEAPMYIFNNFIYTTKQGIASQISIADSERPEVVAANNVIMAGEAALNENVDDAAFKTNSNVLGLTGSNPISSFGISTVLTRKGNIAFMALDPNSRLVDAGLLDSEAYTPGENFIPALDCRGASIYEGKKDIGAYEYNPNGVAAITVEADGPVRYYNLQGIEVANPSNGIFIRRQGNKATKVIL